HDGRRRATRHVHAAPLHARRGARARPGVRAERDRRGPLHGGGARSRVARGVHAAATALTYRDGVVRALKRRLGPTCVLKDADPGRPSGRTLRRAGPLGHGPTASSAAVAAGPAHSPRQSPPAPPASAPPPP